jgi:hypothetical protein
MQSNAAGRRVAGTRPRLRAIRAEFASVSAGGAVTTRLRVVMARCGP